MDRDMLVEEIMRRNFVTTDTDKPVTYILRLMKKADSDGFLAVEDDKLVGLATYWDLMIRLGNLRVRDADASSIYVSSVMEPVKVTLTPKSRVVEAAQRIAEDPAHIIPVLENGQLVGVVEAKDLAKVLLDEDIPASSISLRNIPTVNMSDRVIHARKLMMDSGLRSLATFNEGVVVGVVNDDQIAEAYINLILSMPMEKQKAQIKHLLVA
ncbi:MAG: CBS domain-containing protein, partial [Candidatus Nezhaarchaeales archaeon]